MLCAAHAKADVGQTHQLKNQRSEILHRIDELKKDSVVNLGLVDSLQQTVIALDAQIMSSYDETVTRMAQQKRSWVGSAQGTALLALIAITVALLAFALLGVARQKVMANENVGFRKVYKEMGKEFLADVSSDDAADKRVLRVNVVLIIGLLFMGVSVVAFLLRTL